MSAISLKGDYFQGKYHTPKKIAETIEKTNPSNTSQVLWRAECDLDHVGHVVESAVMGFETWRKTDLAKRCEILMNYRKIVESKKNEIAHAISLETGKPVWEALTEAAGLASKVDVTIKDSLERIKDKTISEIMPMITGHEIKKPLGPCLVIGPFNFPCHLANGQIISALLTGNSIIFKPSEKTFYSSQLMFDCLTEAGFPNGVVNFILGGAKIAGALTSHKNIKGVFFTGSRNVGLKILENTYKDLNKLVALELGGKNATIVHHDCDTKHAMPELIRACFLTSGQRCTSTSTIFIHKDIEQQFVQDFVAITKRLIVDHPTEFVQEPFMGPIIDEAAVKVYKDYCQQAKKEGAEALIDFSMLELKYPGHYVSPTVHYFKHASHNYETLRAEIFAPNVVFVPYTDIDEAIALSNLSDYGLAGAIFTADQSIYHKCLADMQVGILNLNRSTVGASARLPFGGLKHSGNHRPAGVSMIEHCVHSIASLETMQTGSSLAEIKGLRA
jgi:succinylglutamic semialdehyde dehydrogenase